MIELSLQYISQGKTPEDHIRHIEQVCQAGGRWIQLRLKDTDMASCMNAAIQCRNICDRYGAIMIINDNVSIAKAALADGIHLGLNDMNPIEAREILGDNFIIGGTANTAKDCIKHIEDGVDYIGLGPFRHTTTKKKLSPILGLEGYQKIVSEVRLQNSKTPIVAIGGITKDDILELLKTGVSGIAVSGMLSTQDSLEEKIQNIKTLITEKSSIKS